MSRDDKVPEHRTERFVRINDRFVITREKKPGIHCWILREFYTGYKRVSRTRTEQHNAELSGPPTQPSITTMGTMNVDKQETDSGGSAGVSSYVDALRDMLGFVRGLHQTDESKHIATLVTSPEAVRRINMRLWIDAVDAAEGAIAGNADLMRIGSELTKEIARLRQSRDFYARRYENLQAVQSRMRDPERKAVCDILANGSTKAL